MREQWRRELRVLYMLMYTAAVFAPSDPASLCHLFMWFSFVAFDVWRSWARRQVLPYTRDTWPVSPGQVNELRYYVVGTTIVQCSLSFIYYLICHRHDINNTWSNHFSNTLLIQNWLQEYIYSYNTNMLSIEYNSLLRCNVID